MIMINNHIDFQPKKYPSDAEGRMKRSGSLLKQIDFGFVKTMTLIGAISNKR